MINVRRAAYLAGFALLLVVAPAGFQVSRLAAALPVLDGETVLSGLETKAEVRFDHQAIPTITAGSAIDAYRVMGFLHARERLFQMDLMRRKTAGRLAEIFGSRAVAWDKGQRVYPFESVARAVVAGLPARHRQILEAYSQGVNSVLEHATELGLEFRVLRYKPEPWRPEDTLLVALGMFQTLNGYENDERMLTLLTRTLPAEVTAFLTPDTDADAVPLIGGVESHHPPQPVPRAFMASGLADQKTASQAVGLEPPAIGSNNWAVAGSRTKDGRALIANDMHLPLQVPGIWYRAVVQYQDKWLAGVTLPGVPLVVVGSNGHVAWGFTNVDADLLDLVQIETDENHPDQYRTPQGLESWATREELIRVKDAEPERISVRDTRYGPISPEPLMGHAVALHWTALQPEAVNFAMLDLDATDTLETAMALFNRAGAPPQNVVLADDRGRIGWTYTGFFPVRSGFDGRVSVPWHQLGTGWQGYIPPDELPRLINPPEGYLATANNRTLGKGYPHLISHAFSHSYRAKRISTMLASQTQVTETDMLNLQLDTRSEFYEYYRELAQTTVRADVPVLVDVMQAISLWNGRMDADSKGIGLLIAWRKILAEQLFGPLVAPCKAVSDTFVYSWREQETPLRALIEAQIPPPGYGNDWSRFIRDTLMEAARSLPVSTPQAPVAALTWADANPIKISHPFTVSMPFLAPVLDMNTRMAAGCNTFCVKVLNDHHGASERLVISPNHPDDGILQMPGGQSGHPLSPHYRDQNPDWLAGNPSPFLPQSPEHTLHLHP
ncbi:MAG: penicillin acylase family protein [Methylococcaceae bacterium]